MQLSPRCPLSQRCRVLWGGQGEGQAGPPLTFLRLEEAVLTQLGQQRTASAGGLEVAQGNVRRVEPVRQMGEACRKTGTEEGNMFQPLRVGTSPAGAQTVGAGGPSRASSGGCKEARGTAGRAQPLMGGTARVPPFLATRLGVPQLAPRPAAPLRDPKPAAGALRIQGAASWAQPDSAASGPPQQRPHANNQLQRCVGEGNHSNSGN